VLNEDLDLKNPTVEARKIFNLQRLRETYKRNRGLVDITEFGGIFY
jgi:hypothetical protein